MVEDEEVEEENGEVVQQAEVRSVDDSSTGLEATFGWGRFS